MERRLRVAAMVNRKSSPRIQRYGRTDFTQDVDRLVGLLNRESWRRHFDVGDCRKNTHGNVVRLGKSRTGLTCSRQTEDRHRQTCPMGEQQALLGHEFAPGIAEEPQRENPFHAGEVRLHLIPDAVSGKLSREGAKVLREHTHGGGVEQVLVASTQTQLQGVANAVNIDLADGGVGRCEGQIGGKMVDGVCAVTQRVIVRFGKAESGFRDVTDHRVDTRFKRLIPDFSLLQGSAEALGTMFDIFRPDDAVHRQI